MRIAVLDNDPQQRALMTEALATAQHECIAFGKVEALAAELRNAPADLLIYHWQPESEGLRQLRELRQKNPSLPVLLVTGRAPERELAEALEEGSCDYLVKPVRRRELPLRVRILLTRTNSAGLNAQTVDFGGFAFDVRSARLHRDGEPVVLTQKEFDLALLFFRHLGKPLSRATLQEAVWPQETEFNSRTLDTHVSRVRNKLGLRPENGFRLAPVYSYGYRLEQLPGPKV